MKTSILRICLSLFEFEIKDDFLVLRDFSFIFIIFYHDEKSLTILRLKSRKRDDVESVIFKISFWSCINWN